MKTFLAFFTNNWWLKLLALVLAIVLYHSLKEDSRKDPNHNDRIIFQGN